MTAPATRDDLKSAYTYLRQGTWWVPKSPRPRVRVAEMDLEWRFNSARWLERRAPGFADAYGWGEFFGCYGGAPDDVVNDMLHWDDQRRRAPHAWIRTTVLYRSLVAALPAKRKELAALADRARHWTMCPARRGDGFNCGCEVGPVADMAEVAAVAAVVKSIRAAAGGRT